MISPPPPIDADYTALLRIECSAAIRSASSLFPLLCRDGLPRPSALLFAGHRKFRAAGGISRSTTYTLPSSCFAPCALKPFDPSPRPFNHRFQPFRE